MGVNEKAKLTEEEKKAQEEKDKDVKGIPHFWLTIFKNVELISDMIQEPDEPALEALKDVTVTFTEKDPMSFTLHFYWAPNDFFSNEILTKTYELKCEPRKMIPLHSRVQKSL